MINEAYLENLSPSGRARVLEQARTGMSVVANPMAAAGLPTGFSQEDCAEMNRRRDELNAVFALVRPRDNWKGWIEGVVPTDRVPIIAAAIEFFCGSLVLARDLGNGQTAISAPGYYESMGA